MSRPLGLQTQLRRELKEHTDRATELFEMVYEWSKDPGIEPRDRLEAAKFYINHVVGLPTARIDQTTVSVSMSPEDYSRYAGLLHQATVSQIPAACVQGDVGKGVEEAKEGATMEEGQSETPLPHSSDTL